MAEIKIEKRGGGLGWLWAVLGLILLALLAWWLLGRGDERQAVAGGEVAPAAAVGTGVVTDWSRLADAQAGTLVGQPVALADAPVVDVVSDRGFWIGDATARTFVVRGNQSLDATAPDGAVNAGQRVAVWGTVQGMPADLTQQGTEWNLRSTDRDALAGQPAYVMADSVRIVSR